MNIYAWLLLLSSIVSTTLGISVYLLNKKSLINKLFMAAALLSAYWSLTEFMMRTSNTALEADLWNKVGFLWPFVAAVIFQFSLFFTENHWVKRPISHVFIFAPAVFFSLVDLTTNLISGPAVATSWGYIYSNAENSVLYPISDVWVSTLAFLALFLCIRYYYQ